MTNNHEINQAPKAENESDADAPPIETSTPHFDDIAVAFAQPVQPLGKLSHGIKSSASVLRSLLFALLVCVVVATLATAVSLFGLPRHEETSDALAVPTTSAPVQADISGGVLQSNEATQLQKQRRHSRRRFARPATDRILVIAEDDEGRPMPRKFGEVRIGRGSDRP